MKPELVKRYVDTGKVRFVWRDFAWIGSESRLAAQGARCAARQGRFWEFHDHLYANQRGYNQGHFAAPNLRQFAQALRLDAASFGSCLERGADAPAIERDLADGRARGIQATPVVEINGRRLAGGQSFQVVGAAIDAELARLGR